MKKSVITGPTLSVRVGWLIDGSGGPIRTDSLIRIRNGVIQEILPYHPDIAKDADVLTLSDCTILPGLIDAHVHLFMSGTADQNIRKQQLDAGFAETEPVIAAHIRQHLSYGVIAVRDGGDRRGHVCQFKTDCFDPAVFPIILKTAGKAWYKPGRYGSLIGRTPSEGRSLADCISDDSDKTDHVKIVNSGINSLMCFGKETPSQFSPDELGKAVAAAKRLGLKTMIHANGKEPVRNAAEAGCDSVEHGFLMGSDNLKRMADLQTAWVPTACTMKGYSECIPSDDSRSETAKRYLDHQLEQLFQARLSGVTVIAGTDAGSMGVRHGAGIIQELKLFTDAGFSIQGALRCACADSAKLLGIEHAGSLARNKSATFIAVKGSPATLPESIAEAVCLFINGVCVKNYFPQT